MSKKGGKRKKQHHSSRPGARSAPPSKASGGRASAAPSAPVSRTEPRFDDGRTLTGIGPSSGGSRSSRNGDTLRFDAQPLLLPSSSERLVVAPRSSADESPAARKVAHPESVERIAAEAKTLVTSPASPVAESPKVDHSGTQKIELAPIAQSSVGPARPSDISVPPAVDDGDDTDEPDEMDRFFAEGERSHQPRVSHPNDEIELDPRSARKQAPAVVARRERFAKYVKLAVAGAAMLCLAAAVRGAVAKISGDPEPPHVTVTAAPPIRPEEPKPAAATATVPAAVNFGVSTTNVPTPSLAGTSTGTAVALAPAAPAAVDDKVADKPADKVADKPADKPADKAADKPADKPADTAAPAAQVPTGDKTAAQEKKASQTALERGKTQDAIDAGERSVALDPTDGEAWLILGAAYQMKAKHADAARCFAACVKQGKKGPIHECRAMLR